MSSLSVLWSLPRAWFTMIPNTDLCVHSKILHILLVYVLWVIYYEWLCDWQQVQTWRRGQYLNEVIVCFGGFCHVEFREWPVEMQNEMERRGGERRSALEERCTTWGKEKSNRKTNMDLIFLGCVQTKSNKHNKRHKNTYKINVETRLHAMSLQAMWNSRHTIQITWWGVHHLIAWS